MQMLESMENTIIIKKKKTSMIRNPNRSIRILKKLFQLESKNKKRQIEKEKTEFQFQIKFHENKQI